jgi:penicillin amidase
LGTNTTVRAAGWKANGLNDQGASWRFVRDFSQPDFVYPIVAPGQRGHPLSDM